MTDENPVKSHPWALAAFGAVIAVSMFGAGAAWQRFFRTLEHDRPLTVTACTPESYDMPAVGHRGPDQHECDAPGAGVDVIHAASPVTVAGQVCNDADRPIPYRVAVSWVSVDEPGVESTVIDVPITYEPGCQLPYLFDFLFPAERVTVGAESLGRWRIVGRADPVDDSAEPYSWDALKTVEIYAGDDD